MSHNPRYEQKQSLKQLVLKMWLPLLALLAINPALAEKSYVSVNLRETDGAPPASLRTYISSLRSAIGNNWAESAPHKSSPSVYFAVDADGNLLALEVKQSGGIQSDDTAALEAISKCFISESVPRGCPLKIDIVFKPCEADGAERPAASESINNNPIPWDKLAEANSPNRSPWIQPDSPNPDRSIPSGTQKPAANPDQKPAEELLTLPQARAYMLYLINRDRATEGGKPVELDEVACRAGQFHTDTMAKFQFNSHWHPDGKKPPQRYSELGGFDYVGESSHGCSLKPGYSASIPDAQLFTKSEIESEEHGYFDEKPPHDGHRRNILNAFHTHVGVGLTLIELRWQSGHSVFRRVASAQEFINKYSGNYSESARCLRKGETYSLSGQLAPGVRMYCAMITREDAPQTIPMQILQDREQPNIHGGYTLPKDIVASVFPMPRTFTQETKLYTQGPMFRCEITPGSHWQPGLYYITLFALIDSAGTKPQPISLHTLLLE
jgi:uncharacterized protein YkwD